MTTELIEHLEQGVLTLTLNRPERLNALTVPMTEAFAAAPGTARAVTPNRGTVRALPTCT